MSYLYLWYTSFFTNKDLDDHFNKAWLLLHKLIENWIVVSKKIVVLAQNKINYLRLEIEKEKRIMQKHVLEKLQIFLTKLKDKKKLQRFQMKVLLSIL